MTRNGSAGATALVVIAKEPVSGAAKTRLIPALGAEGAARAAEAMLADTLSVVRTVRSEHWLCYAPADAADRLACVAPGFRLLAQQGGDLGDRLDGCLRHVLEDGARRVVIVGADTPHVPAAIYRRAFSHLASADVVLGPALDGGYYLIGARAPEPQLFTGIPMGTEVVLEQTVQRAERLGLQLRLLPPLRDLDCVEDLQAALDDGDLESSPRTRAVAEELLERPAPSPGSAAPPAQ